MKTRFVRLFLAGMLVMFLHVVTMSAQTFLADVNLRDGLKSPPSDFTHLVAFSAVQQNPCLMGYNTDSGRLVFWSIPHAGAHGLVTSPGPTVVSDGYGIKYITHFVAITDPSSGPYNVVVYNTQDGTTYLNRVDKNCNGTYTLWSGNIGPHWTNLMPFYWSSFGNTLPMILAYNSSTGEVSYYHVAGQNNNSKVEFWNSVQPLSPGFTHFMPFRSAGLANSYQQEFAAYNTTTGNVEFRGINTNWLGNPSSTSLIWPSPAASWGSGWTQLIAPPADMSDLRFDLYSSPSNYWFNSVSLRIESNGNGADVLTDGLWDAGWTASPSFYFTDKILDGTTEDPGFVLYNGSTGRAQLWLF